MHVRGWHLHGCEVLALSGVQGVDDAAVPMHA